MRTVTIQLYHFAELSPKAKQWALFNVWSVDYPADGPTLKQFAKHAKLNGWEFTADGRLHLWLSKPERPVFAGTAKGDRTNPRIPKALRTAPQALKEDTHA